MNIKIVRITNSQVIQLEEIIVEKGLKLSQLPSNRTDSVLKYQFISDYFSFEITKKDAASYYQKVQWVSQKEPDGYHDGWDAVLRRFSNWCAYIAEDIEQGKKVYQANTELTIQDAKIQKLLDMSKVLSPKFHQIFSQSFHAQESGLNEICGLGFRKAFEFLIKDYVIREWPEETERIKEMPIMQCINKYVNDDKIKVGAHRVLWLGNDHAHYYQIFEDKTVDDLKELIYHTLKWIDLHEELLILTKQTEDFEKSIPFKGKK
jgi:hypothetical protein